MYMHDTLYFLNALHAFIEASVDNRGPWCWPTRELASFNLRRNRMVFPRDNNLRQAFNRCVADAKLRGWIVEGPCAAHCHARHLSLTALGKEALDNMNLYGCKGDPRECERTRPELRLRRVVG